MSSDQIDAQDVISDLARQVAAYAVDLAVARARIVQLEKSAEVPQ